MLGNSFRTILSLLSCVAAGLAPSHLLAQTAYAVTGTGQGQLVRFDVNTPGTITSSVAITGLGGGETILGMDFRPATAQLYALGSLSRLYTLNTTTGIATQVGASGGFGLSGTWFGFDFNPVVDRIRVVSDLDQNLRLNPSTGALAATDTALNYAVGDVNASFNPWVTGSAYASNFVGATTTTLYALDASRDVLAIQNPPNGGTLNTVGPLGVNVTSVMGFDILTSGGVDTGYAALQNLSGGSIDLYRINLTTGAATLLGNFGASGSAIHAFALAPPDPPRLANISTRAQVLTGDDVMIGGFVVGAGGNKTVAIVATGPSLAAFGISNPLANPTLTLVRSSDQAVLGTNDDWQSASNASQLQAAGLAPSNPQEAALLVNLPPGGYTAIVQGAAGGTGVSVTGVYEVDNVTVPLTNISTRARVLTGDNVMIGGFVIQGVAPQTVAVVGTGPSLAAFGILSPLANPTLTLVRSSDQSVVDSNDDWPTHPNALQLQAAGLAPSNPLESAIYITLQPGAYTAILSGVGGGTGIGVVAVYKVN